MSFRRRRNLRKKLRKVASNLWRTTNEDFSSVEMTILCLNFVSFQTKTIFKSTLSKIISALKSSIFPLSSFLYTLHSTLYTLYSILYTLYSFPLFLRPRFLRGQMPVFKFITFGKIRRGGESYLITNFIDIHSIIALLKQLFCFF